MRKDELYKGLIFELCRKVDDRKFLFLVERDRAFLSCYARRVKVAIPLLKGSSKIKLCPLVGVL